MRIGFFARHFAANRGGLERFCSRLTNFLCIEGDMCVIFHQNIPLGTPVFPLHPNTEICALDLSSNDITHAKYLIKEKQLDVFCVLYGGADALWGIALCNGSGIPLLLSERMSPFMLENYGWPQEERIACLAGADAIHLLSSHYLKSLPPFLQKRTTVIPNPAPELVPIALDKKKKNRKLLLAVSRLEDILKQVSLFIQAFSLVAVDFPDWDCCICGDGLGREAYMAMIEQLQLTDRIKLAGSVKNLDAYYMSADLYCISSASEGFPNSLLEAQSYGLACVGFAACTGVNEIILHGENGLLAERMTAESLANALRQLMEHPCLRDEMGINGQKLLSRYRELDIFDYWKTMIYTAAQNKGHTQLDNKTHQIDATVSQKLKEILVRKHPFDRNRESNPNLGMGNLAAALRSRLKR